MKLFVYRISEPYSGGAVGIFAENKREADKIMSEYKTDVGYDFREPYKVDIKKGIVFKEWTVE